MRIEGATASWLLTGAFVAAGIAIGGWLGVRQMAGIGSGLDGLENLTLDWRFLLAGARPAPPGVVIVAIDDEALSEGHGHPLSREFLARVVRAIGKDKPRAVSIDMAFPDLGTGEEDAELADALRSTTSVVASIGIFDPAHPASGEREMSELAYVPRPSGVLWPIDEIRDATQTGLANVSTDASGIPRYVPMLFETPDGVVPSFALAAASAAVGAQPVIGLDRIKIADRIAPMDIGYHLPIRYYGPAGTIPRYGAAKALKGELRPELLRDQVVLIGVTATGVGDRFATPFDRVAPGV